MAKIALTRVQVDQVRQLAHREQLRCEAVLKILVATKIRSLWEDEKKCLHGFLQEASQEEMIRHISQCELNIKTYDSIADAFTIS